MKGRHQVSMQTETLTSSHHHHANTLRVGLVIVIRIRATVLSSCGKLESHLSAWNLSFRICKTGGKMVCVAH